MNSLISSYLEFSQVVSSAKFSTDYSEDDQDDSNSFQSKFNEDLSDKDYDPKALLNMLENEKSLKPLPQVYDQAPNSYLKIILLTLKFVEVIQLETEIFNQAHYNFIAVCALNLALKCYDQTKNCRDLIDWINHQPEQNKSFWIDQIFYTENIIYEKLNWNVDQITISDFIKFFLDNHFYDNFIDQEDEEILYYCVLESFSQFKWQAFSIAIASLSNLIKNYWEDHIQLNYLEFLVRQYNRQFQYQDEQLLISEIQEIIQHLEQKQTDEIQLEAEEEDLNDIVITNKNIQNNNKEIDSHLISTSINKKRTYHEYQHENSENQVNLSRSFSSDSTQCMSPYSSQSQEINELIEIKSETELFSKSLKKKIKTQLNNDDNEKWIIKQ